jgi:hypothetical protein
MVTVIRGPLQGLHGRLVRHTTGVDLLLAVHQIQQAVAVDIALEDVALAEDQTRSSSSPRTSQQGSGGGMESQALVSVFIWAVAARPLS